MPFVAGFCIRISVEANGNKRATNIEPPPPRGAYHGMYSPCGLFREVRRHHLDPAGNLSLRETGGICECVRRASLSVQLSHGCRVVFSPPANGCSPDCPVWIRPSGQPFGSSVSSSFRQFPPLLCVH